MNKKLFVGILAGIVVICSSLVAIKAPVQAATNPLCVGNAFGIPYCRGYFKGGSGNVVTSTRVLPSGLNTFSTGALEATINADLNYGSCSSIIPVDFQNEEGATFIIETMLGHSAPAIAGYSACNIDAIGKADYQAWVSDVNYVDSLGPGGPGRYGIDWSYYESEPIDTGLDSAWFPNMYDDAFHSWYPPLDNGFAILFTFPGGSFSIGQSCGNVQDTANALPSKPSPTGTLSVACDVNTGQQVADISYTNATAQSYISVSGWNSGLYNSGAMIDIPQSLTNPYGPSLIVTLYNGTSPPIRLATAQTQVPCMVLTCGTFSTSPSNIDPYITFYATVTIINNVNQPPPGATMSLVITPPRGPSYRFNKPATNSGSTSSATFSLGPTGQVGSYNATWTLSAPGISKSCSQMLAFSVVYLPYLQIYGGDVMTGASPTSASGQCLPSQPAGIFSWNNDTTNFSGAGVQYAIQALGQIQDFASAQNSSSSPPTGLSFSNTVGATGTGLFGGNFGDSTADCDFTSDLSGVTQQQGSSVSLPSSVNGTVTIYAKGNVYIGNNVVYTNSTSWTNPSQIPDLRLVVVGGSIYIGSNVTELDGLYVAETDSSGIGGDIYTCATGNGAPVLTSGASFYTTCDNQLKIYGSFVAQQVEFLRTFGSLGHAMPTDTITSNDAAEVFEYTPELWLPRSVGTPNSGYNAIVGLPPVL